MVIKVEPKHSFTYDGTTVNIYHANKGEGVPMHNHIYSHASACVVGSCKYICDGKELIANKNTKPINLLGGSNHEIESMENGTVFLNIFSEGKR